MKLIPMGWIVPLAIALGGCAGAPKQTASPRKIISLDSGWRFVRSDLGDGGNVALDDSGWESVSLPHTWNNMDGQDGGNDYWRGASWYRRHLDLSKEKGLGDRRFYLCFDGASIDASAFVNGKFAGEHKGAFAGFVFDVTDLLNPAGDNVIAVRVSNAKDADIPPLQGDFTMFGGIYRHVKLLETGRLAISPVDDGGPGVYLTQKSVSADRADISATVKLLNMNPTEKDVQVWYEVMDAGGKVMTSARQKQNVGAHSAADATRDLVIDHPHLWNGRVDPYLYTVHVAVADGNQITDEVTQPLGLRSFRVDPEKGFFLNGVSYPLHGVNRHQDRLDEGWAISDADHKQDFDLIMEMGCTGIRLAHYQHSQTFYDLCDQGGLVVWAEACMINEVTNSPGFDAAAKQQVRELIKQNFNHPSICFWSVFNELGPGKKGASSRPSENPQLAHQVKLVGELNDLAHELDSTRLTTAATNQFEVDYPVNVLTDVLGYNTYYGWYYGTPDDLGKHLDDLHAARPDFGIGLSEYGAGGSAWQHEPDVKQPKTKSPWHPEEWQAEVHESAWRAIKDRPYLWGSFLWNMFDFAVDSRNEGDHPGRNDKGMITYDRVTKKDAFYFYKANWSSDPFVYITDRRFTPRNVGTGPVKIYSNCDSVELFVNGSLMTAQNGDDVHIFLWDSVQLWNGKNTIEAVGRKGGKEYRDQCEIVVEPGAATREEEKQ